MNSSDPHLRPSASPFGETASAGAPDAVADGTAAREPGAPAAVVATLLPELRIMVGLGSAAVIVAALYFGRDILMPLSLALLLGFVLEPVVHRFRRLGMPRPVAVAAVVVLTVGLLGMAALFIGSQVTALSAQLPTYQSNIKTKLRAFRETAAGPGRLDGVVRTLDAVRDEVDRATVSLGQPGTPRGSGTPVQRVEIQDHQPTPLEQLVDWIQRGSGPLATAGVTIVFVVFVLLDRLDLRDRVLRLWGSASLHRSTDAMDEAGRRISKYLTMQVVVNLSYGVPMAAGLWVIGVPGSILWGATASVTRFVPYVGPVLAAVFPLTLAFAVDQGWSMLGWTLILIIGLEVLVNNLVEPWLYGSSTGLSAMSLIVAATFWTALWGPVGLIMSTPLTVCLLVIGRHLPRLGFLDVLLGSRPALDTPTRIYQRLLAGDVEEAIELSNDHVVGDDVGGFYNDIGLPVLRMAADDHARVATAEHRHRLVVGMDAVLDDLVEQHAPPDVKTAAPRPGVICLGGKWEVDDLSARMLVHALSMTGLPAERRPVPTVASDYLARLDLANASTVCIVYFSPHPDAQARHLCRRIRRRWPDLPIVLALWSASPELLGEAALQELGADAMVTSITEAVARLTHAAGLAPGQHFVPAEIPAADPARVEALKASGALDPRAQPLFDAISKRAADIFDVPLAVVSLVTADQQLIRGAFGELPGSANGAQPPMRGDELAMPRSMSMCGHAIAGDATLVVPDISRDFRFAGNPALQARHVRFYAGAPLKDRAGHALGSLCLLDTRPRRFDGREVRLLEAMAADLMGVLESHAAEWRAHPVTPVDDENSATVGALLPDAG